jgi:hypothetical protein
MRDTWSFRKWGGTLLAAACVAIGLFLFEVASAPVAIAAPFVIAALAILWATGWVGGWGDGGNGGDGG